MNENRRKKIQTKLTVTPCGRALLAPPLPRGVCFAGAVAVATRPRALVCSRRESLQNLPVDTFPESRFVAHLGGNCELSLPQFVASHLQLFSFYINIIFVCVKQNQYIGFCLVAGVNIRRHLVPNCLGNHGLQGLQSN